MIVTLASEKQVLKNIPIGESKEPTTYLSVTPELISDSFQFLLMKFWPTLLYSVASDH